ncbi:MAG: spore germination protein, partial [Clostridia bacterium]|nr:spore germination protein [Clostridia bacterium]
MQKITSSLNKNCELLERRLGPDRTLISHRFRPSDKTAAELSCCLYCIDGMVDSKVINQSIVRPVVTHRLSVALGKNKLSYLASSVLYAAECRECDDLDELIYALLYGDTVLFCEGCSSALIIGTKGFSKRSLEEPPTDPLLKGPREGFTEVLLTNVSLLRRKIRSAAFKTEFFRLGDVTKTTCCLCYVSGCADEAVLSELKARLLKIRIDGLLDTNYVSELISDGKWSLLRSSSSTERPDVAAAKLLEGRIALFVDGSPVAITVPYIFIESFQSPEDYYVNFWFAAINRSLRIIGFILSVSVVPIFVAIMKYHRELIPTQLLLSMAAARQGVPFVITAEAFILLFTFELLREAGTRTPANTGQTLSIVGGLVVGQA